MRLVSGYICEGLSRLSKLRWEDPSWLWGALYQRLEQGKVSWASALIAFGLRQRQMQSISCFQPFPTKTDFQNNWAKRKPPFLRLLFCPILCFFFCPILCFNSEESIKTRIINYDIWVKGLISQMSLVHSKIFSFVSPLPSGIHLNSLSGTGLIQAAQYVFCPWHKLQCSNEVLKKILDPLEGI